MSSSPPVDPDATAPATADRHPLRAVRSFGTARGRVTAAQKRAYEEDFPGFRVPYQPVPIDTGVVFGRQAPVVLEIGFGMGETTARIAAANPDLDFLVVEVFVAGIGALSRRLSSEQLRNVRIIQHDAADVVRNMLAPASLHGVHLFFPDPWPKHRHQKRRLLTEAFAGELAARLQPGGYIHCATDWQPYADQMLAALSAQALLRNLHEGFAPGPANPSCERPATKFHLRGERLGYPARDLVFMRR
jgi:tRNA (guanine-N7-)-methyltransferase